MTNATNLQALTTATSKLDRNLSAFALENLTADRAKVMEAAEHTAADMTAEDVAEWEALTYAAKAEALSDRIRRWKSVRNSMQGGGGYPDVRLAIPALALALQARL